MCVQIDSLLAANWVSTSGGEPKLSESGFPPLQAQATSVTAGTERTEMSDTLLNVGCEMKWTKSVLRELTVGERERERLRKHT